MQPKSAQWARDSMFVPGERCENYLGRAFGQAMVSLGEPT